MRETEELAHLDREIERLLRRRLELVAGPESGSTGYDQCRRVLPPAVIAMLIVYCLKGVSFATPAGWVPALLASAAAVLLHLWKGNDLLSIFGGTILYMALVQGVFG